MLGLGPGLIYIGPTWATYYIRHPLSSLSLGYKKPNNRRDAKVKANPSKVGILCNLNLSSTIFKHHTPSVR